MNGAASYAGTSNLAALTIRALGLPVDLGVSTAPNTEIIVPGLARIVLNEQYFANGRLVVNAVHIQVGGILAGLVIADVVISHAEAGITCGSGGGNCNVKDFVTGGGYITLADGSKGTFGMVGGEKPNGLQGHLNYIDHKTGQHIKGTSVTDYAILSPTERRVTYAGTVNGVATTIVVRVCDNGEPGGTSTRSRSARRCTRRTGRRSRRATSSCISRVVARPRRPSRARASRRQQALHGARRDVLAALRQAARARRPR